MTPFVSFENYSAVRPGTAAGFRDFTWRILPGETWAVVGPVAAGKTTLADAVAGRLVTVAGKRHAPEQVRVVGFRDDSRAFSYANHYYQQRYNFVDADDDVSLAAFLRAGSRATDAELRATADRLGVGHLLGRSFLTLSNGQSRRSRIARGLLTKPELLILDEPFLGLDAAGRRDLVDVLRDLVTSGQPLVVLTRPDAVPAACTHVLELAAMRPTWAGAVAEYRPPAGDTAVSPAVDGVAAGDPAIELRDVSVGYPDAPILRNITWTVRAGERWAVLGANGSGKTTLLALLCGDHPQAYAADVRLFGRRRGTGESIWDVKRRVGLVSPELHLYFTTPLTAARVAATGFTDTLVPGPTTPEQAARVAEVFTEMGITHLTDRRFATLSSGEQRLVLIARAVVKRPELLILDEPFQGLDTGTMRRVRDWLADSLAASQTLLLVTHHPDEIPPAVTRTLHLDAGVATIR